MKQQEKKVKNYIEQYITSRTYKVSPSTLRAEKSKAKKLENRIGSRAIIDVTHSDILSLINRLHKRYKNKTINEFLTILRAVFRFAELDGALERNPMTGIQNLKVTTSEPVPFTKAELKKLHDTDVSCQSGKNACLFNALTGLRISELLALSWDDINWQRKEMYVRRAKVLQEYKVPKTEGSVRTVDLNQLATDLLKQQLQLTGKKKLRKISVRQEDNKTLKKESVQFVFYNSKTSKPFLHAAQFSKDFFDAFLLQAEVNHRGVGQLRHTFASQNLTAGISKEWIAAQMGHSGTHMVDKHYGRWIASDAPDCARLAAENLAEAFGQAPVTDASPTSISVETADLVAKLESNPELLAVLKATLGGAK